MRKFTPIEKKMAKIAILIGLIAGTIGGVMKIVDAEERLEAELIRIDQEYQEERKETETKLLNVKLDKYGNCTDTQDTSKCMKELQRMLDKKNPPKQDTSDSLQNLMEAIARKEGFYIEKLASGIVPLPRRFNNPGAMREPYTFTCDNYTIGTKGFMDFQTEKDGFNCLQKSLENYRDKGATIATLIQAWAPTTDSNAPTDYAAKVASDLGVHPDTFLKDLF